MVSLACENIRFSSLFVAEDVSRETSSATKSEEKRMFSQAMVSQAVLHKELDCKVEKLKYRKF